MFYKLNSVFQRELQEANPLSTDPQPAASKALPELPAGLLGLEIPPDVRNVLKVNPEMVRRSMVEALHLFCTLHFLGWPFQA